MKKHHRFKLRIDRPELNGACPVVMVITKNRKRQFVSLKIAVKPEFWDSENECVIIFDSCSNKEEKAENKKRKEYNTIIETHRSRALEIEYDYNRENNSHWTLNQYKEKFQNQPVLGKIEPFLKQYIQTLKETNHYSTSINYNKLYNKLTMFDQDFKLRQFNEIDHAYVNEFNLWLEKLSTSNNTRAFYLKRLCAVYNKAIKSKQATSLNYPFGRNGFIISALATETRKRFMPTEYLEKLKTQKSTNLQIEYARHLFLFSYYCYGMSFKDMACLRKSNIFRYNDGEYIIYKRLKTQEAKAKPINIKITETIKEVIEFLTKYKKPLDDYLLPIVTKQKDSPTALSKHINVVLRLYNKYLQNLAHEFGFDMELTSYVSRHTVAMQLQEKKIPEHIISQMLGHKKLETTKVYLDSLDTSVIDEAVKVL